MKQSGITNYLKNKQSAMIILVVLIKTDWCHKRYMLGCWLRYRLNATELVQPIMSVLTTTLQIVIMNLLLFIQFLSLCIYVV